MEVPEPSTVSFIGAIFESTGMEGMEDMEKNRTASPAHRRGNAACDIAENMMLKNVTPKNATDRASVLQ